MLVDVTNSFFLEGMPNYLSRRRARRWRRCAGCSKRRAARAASSCTRSSSTIPASTITNGASCRAIISSAIPTQQIFAGFEPQGPREIVIGKRRYSAFFATDLALFLHEQKVERVILAGVKTNVCIRATRAGRFRQRL